MSGKHWAILVLVLAATACGTTHENSGPSASTSTPEDDEAKERHQHTRDKLREKLRAGELEDRTIEFQIEERSTVVGVLGNQAMEMDVEFQSMFEKMLPTRRETRKLAVRDAFLHRKDCLRRRGKVAHACDTGHQHLLGGGRNRDAFEL